QNTDPSHANAFGARREPQVFHRKARRVDLDVGDADFAEHRRAQTFRLARDDQVERRFENSLQREGEKLLTALAGELRRIFRAFFFEHALDLTPAFEVA